MKIKTAEATGLQLDWGVAEIMRLEPELAFHECYRHGVAVLARPSLKSVKGLKQGFSHADPAVCMGLIKEHRFPIFAYIQVGGDGCLWQVNYCDADVNAESWESLEQAVARCVIAMKLGDEFECPDELGVV